MNAKVIAEILKKHELRDFDPYVQVQTDIDDFDFPTEEQAYDYICERRSYETSLLEDMDEIQLELCKFLLDSDALKTISGAYDAIQDPAYLRTTLSRVLNVCRGGV